MNRKFLSHFLTGAMITFLVIAVSFLVPWRLIDWGKIQLAPTRTITVVGEAKMQGKSQIATFTAGVSAVNDDKQTAINEVNTKTEALISAVKNFGIEGKDIQTQNLSVYQSEETYYDESGRQKSRLGQWRVNNSINITLRNVEKASVLSEVLTGSGANNVYGPNFSLDEIAANNALLENALADAKKKAEIIAQSSNGKLGKIISITEGYQSYPVFRAFEGGMGGGGAPLEPGSQTVQKSVTVVFELR